MDRIHAASELPSTPAPQSRTAVPVSDDLWTALYRGRRTACRAHSAWVEHCKHLHQRADEQMAGAS
jgi:hypothetical protein